MVNKSYFVFFVFVFVSLAHIEAQDCKLYFTDRVGSIREMTSYDAKDKVTGKIIQEVTSKNATANGVKVGIKTTIFDEKNAQVNSMGMEIVCENNVFKIDMSEYLSEMLNAYKDMELEFSGDNMAFPSKMSVGDKLDDASMNLKVRTGGMQIMNMDVTISNRIVEAKDKITTPAGTFDCYRISYDTQSKTKIINVTTSSTEWIADGVGVVKTESFNKKGKMMSYSLLTKFDK